MFSSLGGACRSFQEKVYCFSMENNVLISIVLASYNHADYISEAVESVLRQDVGGMEVIVVDDGSSDGTPERVEQIKDSRITLIRLNENRRYHPRNTALRKAKGKYIAFQNSDDVWKIGKLKKQLGILENKPDLAACFTDVEFIDENGKVTENSWAKNSFKTKNMTSPEWLRSFFYLGNCLCLPSAVVRRSCLDEAGWFKPELIQLADLDLWIRLATAGGFHIIEEKLTCMRVSDKNLSAPGNPMVSCRTKIEMAEVLENYLEPAVMKRLHEIFFNEARHCLWSETAAIGVLALHSWKLSASHILFANKIISKLLAAQDKREELAKIYGAKFLQKFYKMRGQVLIVRLQDVKPAKK